MVPDVQQNPCVKFLICNGPLPQGATLKSTLTFSFASYCLLSTDLPAAFMREVFDFVTELYHRGQAELEHRSHSHSDKPLEFNPYSLNVHSNAACVDLLFWAIKDEAGSHFVHFVFCVLTCSHCSILWFPTILSF